MKQDRERSAGDTQTGEETKLVREKASDGGSTMKGEKERTCQKTAEHNSMFCLCKLTWGCIALLKAAGSYRFRHSCQWTEAK